MNTTTAGIDRMILDLPADQAKAVAAVLTAVAGQVDAARDAAEHDLTGRWGALSEAASIVGHAAAFARGVAK